MLIFCMELGESSNPLSLSQPWTQMLIENKKKKGHLWTTANFDYSFKLLEWKRTLLILIS